jgi:LysM repeat protein
MRSFNRCIPFALAAGLTAAQSLGAQEPAQPPAPQARTHTVVRGDNLWDLSQTYLGNPFLWPEIYRLNRDVVEDPHWIYPGEVLRLPGDSTLAVSQLPGGVPGPTAAPLPTPGAPVDSSPPVNPLAPTIFSRPGRAAGAPLGGPGVAGTGVVGVVNPAIRPTVRAGEFLAAPYVDREGGPRGYGRILKAADLPGVAAFDERYGFQPFDRVLIIPPAGYIAPEGERYLAVRLGPVLEDQGQIIIPTGVVEVSESARSNTGAVAKITRIFTEMSTYDRLIPLDTAGIGITARPERVVDGPSARVQWIYGEPVLPSVQNFIVLNVSASNGIRMGDEFIIYKPAALQEEGDPREKETLIAKAQVVRSTPYGVSAVIIGQEQPAIREGMSARLSAKMP